MTVNGMLVDKMMVEKNDRRKRGMTQNDG